MSAPSARETRGLPLALVGCDFRVASSAWRSCLPLSSEERRELAARLRQSGAGVGLVALDTCNRTEWIAEAEDPDWAAELLRAWMLRRFRSRGHAGQVPDPYVFRGEDAARHHVRVAIGLESLVPGEREIAGQCNRAMVTARQEKTSSLVLNLLGQAAARTVRRVERLCRFRDASRGVHALAADYLAAELGGIGPHAVGVAGMGEIGRKTAAALAARGHRVFAYNRTLPEGGSPCRPLSALAEGAPSLDALVVATAAPAPVVRARDLAAAPRARPLLVLDLGIPAQVDVEGAGPSVRTAWLDDLVAAQDSEQDAAARATAVEAVALGAEELVLAWRRHRAARLLAIAQENRERLAWRELPSLLDAHLADVPEPRRRRLEGAIRDLLLQHHRQLLREVEGPAAETRR